MPVHKINGIPIALDSAFNRIVRYQVAANREEANELLAHLPVDVSDELERELGLCKEAHRYDLDGKRAYCIQLDGDRLHVWSWNDVEDYVEAGNLLSLIVSLDEGLSEDLANEIYVRATGRNVNQPRPRINPLAR
jgi:hypothetical protein